MSFQPMLTFEKCRFDEGNYFNFTVIFKILIYKFIIELEYYIIIPWTEFLKLFNEDLQVLK